VANRIVAGLAVLGIFVTAYLTLAHRHLLPLACDSVLFDCGKVAQHPLAHGLGIPAFAPIPTAAFGLLFFAALAGLSAVRPLAGAAVGRLIGGTRLALCLLALGAFAVLTYAELFLIRAWCPWCVLAALLTVAIFILLLFEGRQQPADVPSRGARWRETGWLVGGEMLGVLASLAGLWAIKSLTTVPPQPVPSLTRATLPLDGMPRLGAPDAPYTLVQFGHYRCLHCRESQPALNALLQQHAGQMHLIFYPATSKPDARFYLLATAAAAAAQQGQFAAMHHALFDRQPQIGDLPVDAQRPAVVQLAAELHLDAARFRRALADPTLRRQVEARRAMAIRYRLYPFPKYLFFSPTHPAVLLHSTAQLRDWLANPRNW